MLGLILHRRLSPCIHLSENPSRPSPNPPRTSLLPPLLCSLSSLRHVPSSNQFSDCPDSFSFFGLPFLSRYFFFFFYPSPLFCCICVSGFSLIVSLHVSLTPSRFLPLPPLCLSPPLSLYLCLSLCHLDAPPPQQQTSGGLLVSHGGTLRSEGLLRPHRESKPTPNTMSNDLKTLALPGFVPPFPPPCSLTLTLGMRHSPQLSAGVSLHAIC